MIAMKSARSCVKANREPVRRGGHLAPSGKQRGSMLVEVLIAILIFSMGVLALVGLQGAAVKFTTDAKYRSDASFLANQILGQMYIDYANIPSYDGVTQPASDHTTPVDAVLPGGTRNIQVFAQPLPPAGVGGYVVTITVGWVSPGGPNGEASVPHKLVSVEQIHN